MFQIVFSIVKIQELALFHDALCLYIDYTEMYFLHIIYKGEKVGEE